LVGDKNSGSKNWKLNSTHAHRYYALQISFPLIISNLTRALPTWEIICPLRKIETQQTWKDCPEETLC
jgi:hypothetical protein